MLFLAIKIFLIITNFLLMIFLLNLWTLKCSHVISVRRHILYFFLCCYWFSCRFYLCKFWYLYHFLWTYFVINWLWTIALLLNSFRINFDISCWFVRFLWLYWLLDNFIIFQYSFNISLYWLILNFIWKSSQPL